MYLTQGTFSYLPPLTDEQIQMQVQYALDNGWAVSIEHTDDPHPRNVYWEMWGHPMFELRDPAGALDELRRCREAFPGHYVRLNAHNARYGRQTTALSFIVQRPENEPGFRLERQESHDRVVRYALHPYAADRPSGLRYAAD